VDSAREKSISGFTCDKLLGVVIVIVLITVIIGVNSASQKAFSVKNQYKSEMRKKLFSGFTCDRAR
jgi:hypothetical protein